MGRERRRRRRVQRAGGRRHRRRAAPRPDPVLANHGRRRSAIGRVSYVPRAGEPPVPPPAVHGDVQRRHRERWNQVERTARALPEVKVELLEGITAMDGQPLPVWTLTFTTALGGAARPRGQQTSSLARWRADCRLRRGSRGEAEPTAP